MSLFITNVREALTLDLIDETQALYLIFMNDSVDYPITATPLLELTKLKYVINNKVGPTLYKAENVKLQLNGTVAAKYTTDISKQIPKQLCNLFCMRNNKTGDVLFINDDDSITTTADKFLGGEGLIAYHFLIFLYLFPLRGASNKKWEKEFLGQPYKGARLRVRSKRVGKLFLTVARNKDMGIFLYGTYLFIKSCIQEDRTFVKTIPNYMLEYEDWYLEAEELVNNASTLQELFKNRKAPEGRLNVSI